MVKLETFPTEIFIFKNDFVDNNAIIRKLKQKQSHVKLGTNLSYLNDIHNQEEFKNLTDWFDHCLEEIRTQLNYVCEKIEITRSWYNCAEAGRGQHQNYHKHTMSFYSAVYYLTHGAPTYFEDPVIQRTTASQIEVLRLHYNPTIAIDAEPGKLVVFPSWMFHQTPPHVENFDRWIISFNTLPTGKINNIGHDASCYISIKEND